jgi:processive 1,2-diacylglycerol beta-glucosyltransferase
MKRIIILYAAIGGGHYRAADGVKKYIDSEYSGEYNVELVDGLQYVSKKMNNLVISSYVKMARHSPNTWSKIYKSGENGKFLSKLSSSFQKHYSKKLYNLFKDEDPALVISTHYFMTDEVTNLKKTGKTKAKLAVILTDYAPHKFWLFNSEYVDCYFVANNPMKFELSHYGIPEEKVFVTGIPVRPEFCQEYDKSKTLESLGLSQDKPTFLVFGGGQYGMSDSSLIFKGILDVRQDVQIIAIAGKSEKTQKTFEDLAKASNKKVAVLGFTDRVAELMYASDFVFSKPGGLTTTEILVSNKPFFIFSPVPGQEEENSAFLTNNGAGYRLWDLNKVTPLIEEFISDEFHINNMKAMQRHIAKPDSTKNIVEKTLEII